MAPSLSPTGFWCNRARTYRVLSGRDTPARGYSAPLRSQGLSSPEVRHVAIGHGEAAHVSLAPGPEPCSLIAAFAPRRLPRDVTCPWHIGAVPHGLCGDECWDYGRERRNRRSPSP